MTSPKIFREKIGKNVYDSIVDYLRYPNVTMPMAYGVKKMKLESGETVEMANVIR